MVHHEWSTAKLRELAAEIGLTLFVNNKLGAALGMRALVLVKGGKVEAEFNTLMEVQLWLEIRGQDSVVTMLRQQLRNANKEVNSATAAYHRLRHDKNTAAAFEGHCALLRMEAAA